jgi:DNA-binding response OmpR family regulator
MKNTTSKARILVVDDEVGLATEISVALRAAGYLTRVEHNGADALKTILDAKPDLVLLDIMLPGMNGFDVGQQAIDKLGVPIIFMTARDAAEDKMRGLTVGADDYVTKPILMGELLLRVRAVLRRTGVLVAPLAIGELLINEDEASVKYAGEEIHLTNTEYRLLGELARSRGRVLSKNYLLTQVWGYDAFDPNLVEVHVSSLRKKLEAVGCDANELIKTKRGLGYMIKAPVVKSDADLGDI